MTLTNDLYLMHHGIKGMKWGVRRFEDENGHLTPAGKRRYGIQDARKYYKINRLERAKENTNDRDKIAKLNKRIRRTQTRSDRKHADLTAEDINIGREIVAKNRKKMRISATAISAASTAAVTTMLYNNPNTRWAAPLAAAAGTAVTAKSASKIPYYHMEARRYSQVNKKGATRRGMTDIQKKLKKAANVAGTAAMVGGGAALAGYTARSVNKHKAYNQAYKEADPETRKAMDAERHYNQGVAIRDTANKLFRRSKQGAKKAYDVATSPETAKKAKEVVTTTKKVVTSKQTKSALQKVRKAAANAARTTGDLAKGFVGGKKRSTLESTNTQSPTYIKTNSKPSSATIAIRNANRKANNSRVRVTRTTSKTNSVSKSKKTLRERLKERRNERKAKKQPRSLQDSLRRGVTVYRNVKAIKNRDFAEPIQTVTQNLIDSTSDRIKKARKR